MPKKAYPMNQKAAEARERRAAVEQAEAERRQRAAEDAVWQDDDKHSSAKLKRKEDAAAKHEDKLSRRAEVRRLAEAEEEQFQASAKKSVAPPKVTRAELQQMALLAAKAREDDDRKKKLEASRTLEFEMENPNRLIRQEIEAARAAGQELIHASGVDDAVSASSAVAGGDDRPDRRARKAFREYEEVQLPILRAENPSLKRSQLQAMVWKKWQKAPENPFNQSPTAASSTMC